MKKVLVIISILLLSFACGQQEDGKRHSLSEKVRSKTVATSGESAVDSTPLTMQQRAEQRAAEILAALKNRDMEKLTAFVHPQEGVRFSPYGYVNQQTDRILKNNQIMRLHADSTKHLWGHYDGTGDPIRMSFSEYLGRFAYDRDFIEAPEKTYQKIANRGNTLNNAREVYPNAVILEYHFPGFEPDYGGMDWENLRIVLMELNGQLYLTGIIHDQWTI
jgi:hypothetical protein